MFLRHGRRDDPLHDRRQRSLLLLPDLHPGHHREHLRTVKARAFKQSVTERAQDRDLHDRQRHRRGAADPVPPGGRYASGQRVTVSPTAGVTIRYTTNGAEPTEADTVVASAATSSWKPLGFKARAWKPGLQPSPVTIADYEVMGAVAAGSGHTVVLKADRTVSRLVRTTTAGLGDGTTVRRMSPVSVPGLVEVVAIATGQLHTLALKADGTVYTGATTEARKESWVPVSPTRTGLLLSRCFNRARRSHPWSPSWPARGTRSRSSRTGHCGPGARATTRLARSWHANQPDPRHASASARRRDSDRRCRWRRGPSNGRSAGRHALVLGSQWPRAACSTEPRPRATRRPPWRKMHSSEPASITRSSRRPTAPGGALASMTKASWERNHGDAAGLHARPGAPGGRGDHEGLGERLTPSR